MLNPGEGLLHLSVTHLEILYICYLLRLPETGLAGRGAGAEFDQCGIEGIQILTCETPSPLESGVLPL